MPISHNNLIAVFSLQLLVFLYSGLNLRLSHAQPLRGDICINQNYPREPVSSNSNTHVIADNYQFDYPANYRIILINDGSLFVTDEYNYQYFQCLLKYRPPSEDQPTGIDIKWRTLEELQRSYSRWSVNEIARETISDRTATIFALSGAYDNLIQVRIPSRGGYVIVQTTMNDNNQILMEEAFLRILRNIVVP